jgi:catechol-2,3-dioxygenase
MASFDDLQQMYQHLKASGVDIIRVRENAFSVGVYFADPDGNENEVYYEEPGAPWRQGVWKGKFSRKLEEATV